MQLPAWIQKEPEHLRELLIELHWVRHRGMRGLSVRAPIAELMKLAAARFREISPHSQRDLMTSLMEKVLLARLGSEQDQEAVRLYFGIALETWSSSERQRREKTASVVFHQAFSTFLKPATGDERPFLVRVATALYDLHVAVPETKTYGSYTTPYVDRLHYREAFETLVAAGCKLIAFEGEPGNGKTRLADELVAGRMREGDTRAYLDASSRIVLMRDVIDVLQRQAIYRVGDYASTDDTLFYVFAAFICSQDAPTYLIIDNLEDSGMLEILIPPSARPIVVITSRESLLPKGRGKSLTVMPMDDGEAQRLATSLLSDESEPDVEWLVRALGNKPLAIDHVCSGLLADRFMTVQEFCDAFDRRAAEVMKHTKSPGEESLALIYEAVLSRLRQSYEENGIKARVLLELIAFVGSQRIPLELLRKALVYVSPPADGSLAPIEFQSAQRELQRLHLIQSGDDCFAIHQFTQTMLRDILHDVKIERCLALHRILADRFAGIHAGDVLDVEVLRWVPHTLNILAGLDGIDLRQQNEEKVAHSVSVVVQAMWQAGRLTYLAALAAFLIPTKAKNLEEAPWVARTNADYIVFLDFAYHYGPVPRDRYIKEFGRFLPYILPQGARNIYDVDLESYAGTKLLEIAALNYQYDLIHELVARYRARSDGSDKQDIARRGDVLRLTADAYAAQAKWKEALNSYKWAYQVYASNPQSLNCLRGRFATLVGMASVAVDAGYFGPAVSAKENARKLMMENIDYQDHLIGARLGCITVSIDMVLAILQELILSGEDLRKSRVSRDAVFDNFPIHSHEPMHQRCMLAVKYDWACYHLLRGEVSEAAIVFQKYAAEARALGELDASLMYHLGIVKLRIFDGSVSLRDIHRSQRIATQFLDACQMPNRHADAVGTAYVVGVICHASERIVTSLRESARSAYDAIDKNWKFRLLDGVKSERFNPLALFLP
jgi:hypothetical protein